MKKIIMMAFIALFAGMMMGCEKEGTENKPSDDAPKEG